jgi:hypothetical protein
MKNLIACLLGVILVVLQPTGPGVVRAASKDKDEDRLNDCGAVLKEILDIPDDIPQGAYSTRLIAWWSIPPC